VAIERVDRVLRGGSKFTDAPGTCNGEKIHAQVRRFNLPVQGKEAAWI
jgi:hypothetical protein